MPEIKLKHVVSCSSEDTNYPAENLIHGDGFRKWKCAKPGEKQISVTFQIEKACKIHQIDIGNEGSAFVEVLVGKSSSGNDEFQVILVASSFMSPIDSRLSKNMTAVRMFPADKLSKNVLDQKWDRVKVVCTQPFNKSIQYGLAFIKLHSPPEESSTSTPEAISKESKLGGFRLKPEEDDKIKPGTLFSSREKEKTMTPPLTGAAAVRAASKLAEESQRSLAKEEERKKTSGNNTQSLKRKLDESGSQHKASSSSQKPSQHKHQSSAGSSSVRSEPTDTQPPPKKAKSTIQKNVAFNKLMKKVVFVMSGYQNPERGQIRDKALEMGATYKPDWTSGCTHLICAFENTPKYNQVKGKGRIVNKKWILDSYKAKKLLPWRQYRVGRAKSPPDGSTDTSSDEEAESVAASKSRETPAKKTAPLKSPAKKPESTNYDDEMEDDSSSDTEDEIRRVKESENKEPSSSKQANDSIYDASTEEDEPDEMTNGVQTSDTELPTLPDLFRGKKFFFYGNFDAAERRRMRRYIVAYNGSVEEYMNDSVSFVLTRSDWDDDFDEALSDNPSLAFIRPQWLYTCDEQQKYVPYQRFAVMPK